MAGKIYSDDDILVLLRWIELSYSSDNNVESTYRSVGISDAAY